MSETIVPVATLLVYLFICPGCFLWVWLHNRRAGARKRKLRVAEGAVSARTSAVVSAQGDELKVAVKGAA